jgi:hypothetical protein
MFTGNHALTMSKISCRLLYSNYVLLNRNRFRISIEYGLGYVVTKHFTEIVLVGNRVFDHDVINGCEHKYPAIIVIFLLWTIKNNLNCRTFAEANFGFHVERELPSTNIGFPIYHHMISYSQDRAFSGNRSKLLS